MQAGHPSLIVTPVEGVVAGPDRLYVVARHRLLPQPHGFEGFAQIVVDRPASDLAALDLVEHCEAVLPLDPASLADTALGTDHQHAVAQVPSLLDLLTPSIPGPEPLDEDRGQLLVAMADSAVHAVARVHHYLRIEVAQRGGGVAAAKSLVDPLHKLHVLPRHRPASIPPEAS